MLIFESSWFQSDPRCAVASLRYCLVRVLKNRGALANHSQPQSNKLSPLPVPEIEEPESDVVAERAGPSAPKRPKSKKSSLFSSQSSSSKSDVPSKPRPKPHPVKRPSPISEATENDIEIVEVPSVHHDLEPTAQPSAKAAGKRKAIEANSEECSDTPVVESRKKKDKESDRIKQRDKGKKKTRVQPKAAVKASRINHSDEERSKPKTKPNATKRTSPEPVSNPKKSKPKLAQPDDDNGAIVEGDVGAAPKKKKRKINLFPSSQPMTFDWESLPQANTVLLVYSH